MARYHTPTAEQEKAWGEWVDTRPPVVKAIAKRFDPWTLYRLTTTGQRVTLHSIWEDGTLTVNVLGDFNLVMNERAVFGINADHLEECDLPAPDEVLGSILTDEEFEENIDLFRALMNQPRK